MKRRIVSLLIIFVLTVSILPLSGCRSAGNKKEVTRGEWITMLSEAFGLDSFVEESPYYVDVSETSLLFPFVQASAEWDVLSIYSGEELEPDKKVTREEVGSTAAIAAGCKVSENQFDADGTFDSASSIEYAVQYEILKNSRGLSKGMTLEECEAAISAARNAYLHAPIETKSFVVANEEMVDLSALDAEQFTSDGNRFTIPREYSAGVAQGSNGLKASINTGNGIVEVGVGEVFVTAPTSEKPAGIAYKVASIEEVNGTIVFATEEPTLYDLYDELDVHQTVSVDPDDIIWKIGNQGTEGDAQSLATNGDHTFYVEWLAYQDDTPKAVPLDGKTYRYGGYSRDFEVGSGTHKKNGNNRNSSVIGSGEGAQALINSNFVYNDTPSIDDFNGTTDSWTKNLEVDNKFAAGYKITGSITVNALTVDTEIEYNKLWNIPYGVKCASVRVNSDISSSLKMTGSLNERLHIATVPVPVAATGLSVSVDLYLYVDANGDLAVSASLGSSAKVEYSGNKLKHTADSQANANVDADIEIDFGAELAATLEALGIVQIMDIGVKAGGELTASAHVSGTCKASEEDGVAKLTYQESLRISADLFVPVINIYVGGSGTLIGSLGLSGSWNVTTKEKGASHINLVDYEWVFWEETVLADEDGNITSSEATTAGEADGVGASDKERLDFKTYVLTITGDPVRLELDADDGEAAPDVVWNSADPNIAKVDNTGLVTPVSTGHTIVTATLRTEPTVYVKCAVYVEEIGESNWEFLPI